MKKMRTRTNNPFPLITDELVHLENLIFTMSKFDIFNPNSFVIAAFDPEEKLRNSAMGAIGNRIRDLKDLKKKIEDRAQTNGEVNSEYQIAENLKERNLSAYKIMEIFYELSDEKVEKTFNSINKILTIWADKENRTSNWRQILSLFKDLEPYFKNKHSFYDTTDSKINELVSIKVFGNEAWKVYLRSCQQVESLRKQNQKIREGYNELVDEDDDDGDEDDE
jgi:hypothetical protein